MTDATNNSKHVQSILQGLDMLKVSNYEIFLIGFQLLMTAILRQGWNPVEVLEKTLASVRREAMTEETRTDETRTEETRTEETRTEETTQPSIILSEEV